MNRDLALIACGMAFVGSAGCYAKADIWSAILLALAAMLLAAIAHECRDRRSSPDRDETQSGSVGEADRAPVPNGQSPETPMGDSA